MGFFSFSRVLPIAICLSLTSAWDIGQVVKTQSGDVKGHASQWQSEVSEYLGIPFAEAPTGNLRFAAPVAFKGSGTIDAANFGEDCPAPGLGGSNATAGAAGAATGSSAYLAELMQAGRPMGENCLSLNIWTKPQTGEKSKAVLVWFFGGAFFLGNTAAKMYNGARLANDEDVIIVSANYRTNIFGFPGAPGLKNQNPGLIDQRRAIEWVRDNIASFGGDPKRITIFGVSAGGSSVDTYAYAYPQDPIVAGIISESGTISLVPWIGDKGIAAWYGVTQKMGCGGQEAGPQTIECMRTKPAMDIIRTMGMAGNPLMGGFGPVPDQQTYFKDYTNRQKAGTFAKVPILVGNNDNEGGIVSGFSAGAAPATGGAAAGGAGSTSALGGLGSILGAATGIVGSVMSSLMTCGARDAAQARVAAGVKAWRYRYYGTWPDLTISAASGAYHGSEVPIVFGTSQYITKQAPTADEEATSKLMMHAWAEFAKDPQNGLAKLNWPVYDQNKPTLVQIALNNKAQVTYSDNKQIDTQCGSYLTTIQNMLTSPRGQQATSGGTYRKN